MIKYTVVRNKNMVIAELNHTENDVVNKIRKILCDSPFSVDLTKFVMPNRFKSVAKLDSRDTFSEEEGKRVAKEKLMKRYYNSYDKRMDAFRCYLLQLNGKIFEISEIDVLDCK